MDGFVMWYTIIIYKPISQGSGKVQWPNSSQARLHSEPLISESRFVMVSISEHMMDNNIWNDEKKKQSPKDNLV